MQDDIEAIQVLLLKYLRKELSPQEHTVLMDWVSASAHNQALYKDLSDKALLAKDLIRYNSIKQASLEYPEVLFPTHTPPVKSIKRIRLFRFTVAAAVLILISTCVYLFFAAPDKRNTHTVPTAGGIDIPPGEHAATLQLSDGSTLQLSKETSGELTRQGAVSVNTDKGELKYEAHSGNADKPVFNTLSTANGQSYSIVLADNSKVWVNAASSIVYPVSFNGAERRVQVKGEAYFEVAKAVDPVSGKRKPFIVTILSPDGETVEVEVVGTTFNIAAYHANRIVTTLLEGSIQLRSANSQTLIAPRQAALLDDKGNITLQNDVNTALAVAWKNDYFLFDNSDVETVMEQLERWYNVEVVYEGRKPAIHFSGKISRRRPAASVLKALSMANVHCRIDGRKIIVTE
jgi:transmembrane sensor